MRYYKRTNWFSTPKETDELQHHGIKGQEWGVRRFRKKDGTLTPAGKERYDYDDENGGTAKGGTAKGGTASNKGSSDVDKVTKEAAQKERRGLVDQYMEAYDWDDYETMDKAARQLFKSDEMKSMLRELSRAENEKLRIGRARAKTPEGRYSNKLSPEEEELAKIAKQIRLDLGKKIVEGFGRVPSASVGSKYNPKTYKFDHYIRSYNESAKKIVSETLAGIDRETRSSSGHVDYAAYFD